MTASPLQTPNSYYGMAGKVEQTLGEINTPEKTAPRPEENGVAARSSERVSEPVFSADAHQRCPSSSGSATHRPTSLDVRRSSSSTSMTNTSDEPTTSTTDQDEQLATAAVDAFDTGLSQVSNGETQDGRDHLTRLTDLTVVEKGVYVPGVRPLALARSRSPAALPTYLSSAVKSVKSVNPPASSGGFRFTVNRQPWCQFDGNAHTGVVA